MIAKYEELIINRCIPNKYTRWYLSIIYKAKQRCEELDSKHKMKKELFPLLGYVEWHHILPKCMCDIQSELDVKNGVYLTAREHFVCHWLLSKMFVCEKEKMQMLAAITRFRQNKTGDRKLNSLEYGIIRKSASISNSYFKSKHIGWNQSIEMKKKSSASHKKRFLENPELIIERSIQTVNQMKDQKQRNIRKSAMSICWNNYTAEERIQRCNNMKKPRTQEAKDNVRYSRLIKNWKYNKIPSDLSELLLIINELSITYNKKEIMSLTGIGYSGVSRILEEIKR